MTAERRDRREPLDPLPSQHRVVLDESVMAMYDTYVETERRAARVSAIAAWLDRPAARLARRIRRAFRVTR